MANKYRVGYGHPPLHSRFKRGQSGNPRGRSKGTKNLRTDLDEELRETITVREGDRARKVSKQRAMIKSTVVKALKGDVRAVNFLLSRVDRWEAAVTGAAEPQLDLSAGDRDILERFAERARATSPVTNPPAERTIKERKRIVLRRRLPQRRSE
jgi:hypothetical protein